MDFYYQIPYNEFCAKFPKMAEPFMKSPMADDFKNDPDYVVRYCPTLGMVEIGYPDDEWAIK